ncbi:MAG TPA: hypothetical protein VJV05_08185 [Pyrinomonadaceae bacterium]|nr:hypothetical protein [Pyrinomonadaceae bacterium]
MSKLKTILFVAHFVLMMIVLGGTIFSVMVEYPNWFSNVPVSLETTRNFYKVLHPGYFFQTTGPLVLLTGFAFVVVGWRIRQTRNLVLISLGILVAIELLTFIYIYPRLGIMFGPDAAQSVEALRQAASEFTFADRIRTTMAFVASAVSIGALFKFFESYFEMKADLP